MERRLLKLANFDSLTGLGNRAYFQATLCHAMKRQRRLDKTLALLILDLDFFKYVNDNYGHDAGDQLLQITGERLISCVREGDLVARMGGDEFAVMLYDINGVRDISPLVEKILAALTEPFKIKTIQINISASIGIAVFDDEGMTIDNLLKNADTAMYEAKADGRNNYKILRDRYAEERNSKTAYTGHVEPGDFL